jgi:LPXTG-motif cell wall-anchored protein
LEKAKKVDESVHENPWLYIAGVGVFGLLSGYIIGRKTKS